MPRLLAFHLSWCHSVVSECFVIQIDCMKGLVYAVAMRTFENALSCSLLWKYITYRLVMILCRWGARDATWRMQENRATLDSVRRIRDHQHSKEHTSTIAQDDRWAWPEDQDHKQGFAAEGMRARHNLQPWVSTRCRPWRRRHSVEAELEARVDWSVHFEWLWRWLDWCHQAILFRYCLQVWRLCSESHCFFKRAYDLVCVPVLVDLHIFSHRLCLQVPFLQPQQDHVDRGRPEALPGSVHKSDHSPLLLRRDETTSPSSALRQSSSLQQLYSRMDCLCCLRKCRGSGTTNIPPYSTPSESFLLQSSIFITLALYLFQILSQHCIYEAGDKKKGFEYYSEKVCYVQLHRRV